MAKTRSKAASSATTRAAAPGRPTGPSGGKASRRRRVAGEDREAPEVRAEPEVEAAADAWGDAGAGAPAPAPLAQVVVLGGAGPMGRITVRDLVETAPDNVEVVVADRDEAAANRLAESLGRDNVFGCFADASDARGMKRFLSGCFAVINCTPFEFNLKVMGAALAAGAHYLDLGGLFHVTREQLELDAEFRDAGLLALLGMGAAPGISNVLARSAADSLDEVHEIHCMVASVDRTPDRLEVPLGVSYAIDTVFTEASAPAALFTGGRLEMVEPLSGAEPVHFPEPIGLVRPARTLHSEVATLPLTYAAKGVREVSFRIAFPEALVAELSFLRALGLLSNEPLAIGRARVAPRAVLLAALAARKVAPVPPELDQYEVVRAVVRGVRGGETVEQTVDCHVPGIPAWGVGSDVDTGCPPSIAVQMLLAGQITARGVLPPERAVPCTSFFRELLRRGMIVRSRVTARAHLEDAVAAAVEGATPEAAVRRGGRRGRRAVEAANGARPVPKGGKAKEADPHPNGVEGNGDRPVRRGKRAKAALELDDAGAEAIEAGGEANGLDGNDLDAEGANDLDAEGANDLDAEGANGLDAEGANGLDAEGANGHGPVTNDAAPAVSAGHRRRGRGRGRPRKEA